MAAAEAPDQADGAVVRGSPKDPLAKASGQRTAWSQPLRIGPAPYDSGRGRGRGRGPGAGAGGARGGRGGSKGKGRDGRPSAPEVAPAAAADAPWQAAEVDHTEVLMDEHHQVLMDGFQQFVGEWLDSLGHRIVVTPSVHRGSKGEAAGLRRGKGGRKGKGDADVLAIGRGFRASMQKMGMPEKCFTIANDRGDGKEWTCGNGTLVAEESSDQVLVWLTKDGRKSQWTRAPPLGAVYFDPLPFAEGPVYFDPLPGQSAEPPWWPQVEASCASTSAEFVGLSGEPTFELPAAAAGVLVGATGAAPSSSRPTPELHAVAKASLVSRPLNSSRASPILMPVGNAWNSPAWGSGRTPSQSPQLRPAVAPLQQLGPVGGAVRSEPSIEAISIRLSMECRDICVSGPRLEWRLPDPWCKLREYPCDFSVTSPMFGIPQAASMQLAFYPNGTRTTEPGHCTVVLTRGPDSAGIKFEFLVNGRSIGPKVCLGRRYLGDYLMPFDRTPEHADKHVVVTMQVMDVLGT